ncbi:response regulator [Hyunsoonleella pacifica]|uniref:Response regulator transcription factor n=1 Tax=Hyunsoonleella pacifica TaxID=1080224 RepID=A0A4Q9FS02_9FLAO|nr:response regulator transcription factor [Hyunsoonleella pacifica]TBN18834.1 response regulator transcription factor [Hyunsoonleella pacifica]GGD05175.1 DNA-binding response regulator [Hyunsoonleella pacifica]
MITVAIAEDHQALIDGIESYVKYEDDIKVIGHANNGEDLLRLVRLKQPKVVLCDIRMPKLDGIEATRTILKEMPYTKIIAFTMFDQDDAVRQMLEAGAQGYILKNSSLEVVLEAIRTVASGKTYFDKKINMPTAEKNISKSILSTREQEILQLISKGYTSHQIADQLFIGKSTVDTHRKNMIRKLGLNGANELLRYAIEMKYDF